MKVWEVKARTMDSSKNDSGDKTKKEMSRVPEDLRLILSAKSLVSCSFWTSKLNGVE